MWLLFRLIANISKIRLAVCVGSIVIATDSLNAEEVDYKNVY